MEKEIERKCIVTGEVKSKDELLRFTVTPNGEVVPDFNQKLPGRGVYVSNSKEILQKAIDKNVFSKALKQNTKIDKALMEIVESLLKKKGLELINLGRKAGVLVTGFEKVVEAVKKGKATFVLEAKDAGADGHQKIMSAAKELRIFSLYTTEELDKATDRINTVHSAFIKSEMAKTVEKELMRFEQFLSMGNEK